jgi:hypothetical protein
MRAWRLRPKGGLLRRRAGVDQQWCLVLPENFQPIDPGAREPDAEMLAIVIVAVMSNRLTRYRSTWLRLLIPAWDWQRRSVAAAELQLIQRQPLQPTGARTALGLLDNT